MIYDDLGVRTSKPLSLGVCNRVTYNTGRYMTSARVYDSRRPFRSAVCIDDYYNEVLLPDAQLDPGFYMDAYADEKDKVWNWGISGSDKSYFPNVQAYGRHGQENATDCPSVDELRYMIVAPIILGARGIQFYALDLALGSGNGTEQTDYCGDTKGFQCPSELVNWGPSSDIGNPNMLSRINQVINELVNEAPFTSALISSYCYAMNSDEVTNAIYNSGSITPITDDKCSFLALRSQTSGNIYILMANFTGSPADAWNVLYFMNELGNSWKLHNVGGYEVNIIAHRLSYPSNTNINPSIRTLYDVDYLNNGDSSKAQIPLLIAYGGLPAYSTSIFYLEPENYSEPSNSETGMQLDDVLLEAYGIDGSIRINLSIGRSYEEAFLRVYDISGRIISIIWEDNSGEGIINSFEFDNAEFPTGVYYVVLEIDGNLLSRSFTALR